MIEAKLNIGGVKKLYTKYNHILAQAIAYAIAVEETMKVTVDKVIVIGQEKENSHNNKTHAEPKNLDKENNARTKTTHTKPTTTTKNGKQSKMQSLLLQKHMPAINHS